MTAVMTDRVRPASAARSCPRCGHAADLHSHAGCTWQQVDRQGTQHLCNCPLTPSQL